MRNRLAVAVLYGILATGCGPREEPEPEQDAVVAAEDELRAADSRLLQAAQAGDATAFAAMFADDGELKFPNEPALVGPAAIQERTARDFAMPGFRINWEVSDWAISGSADLAVSRGNYEFGLTTPGGPITDRGRFVAVWERNDAGEWKVTTDMISSDVPMNAAPADSASADTTTTG